MVTSCPEGTNGCTVYGLDYSGSQPFNYKWGFCFCKYSHSIRWGVTYRFILVAPLETQDDVGNVSGTPHSCSGISKG